MASMRMQTKWIPHGMPEGKSPFTLSGESPERKRKFEDQEEVSNDEHINNATIFSDHFYPVVSSCCSESCEQSISTFSNFSAQAFSNASSRPVEPPSLVEQRDRHCDRRLSIDTGKSDGCVEDDSLSFCIDSRPRYSKVRDVLFASREKPDDITWNSSSWDLCSNVKKEKETIHSTPSITSGALFRGKKVEGERHATKFHSEDPNWEGTSWNLQKLSHARKKQKKTKGCIGDVPYVERTFRTKEKVLEDCCVPKNKNSIEWKLWKISTEQDNAAERFRLPWIPIKPNRKVTLATGQPRANSPPSSGDSPYILYRWLRMRLAAGLVGSSFNFLHQMLSKYYYQAEKVFSSLEQNGSQEDSHALLLDLRDRLAGLWCVYSHFSLEVGCLALAESKKTDESNGEFNITPQDISNHAISILLKARDCPFVGSHAAIAVSLVRLIVSSAAMEQKKNVSPRTKLSRQLVLRKIRSAIGACWDSIDVMKRSSRATKRFTIKGVPKKTLRVLSTFEVPFQKLQSEQEIGKTTIEEGIESTLFLPMFLRKFLPSNSLLSERMADRNKNAISCMCIELNRLSRLGEFIEFNSHKTIRLAQTFDPELSFAAEELPLLAAVEALSDPLNIYEEAETMEKGVIWQW